MNEFQDKMFYLILFGAVKTNISRELAKQAITSINLFDHSQALCIIKYN